MKRLKKRTRADTLVSEPRAKRSRMWDRAIYLVILAAFFVGLANYTLGDRLFLRADGLILQDRTEIGATGIVQITAVGVRPGQTVAPGDLLVRAESLDTLVNLAELSMREAELAERAARLGSDLVTTEQTQPRAEARRDALQTELARLQDLQKSGLTTSDRVAEMMREALDAEDRVASLRARAEGLSAEVTALEERRGLARDAIQQLRTRYRDGNHFAAVHGTVGDSVPAPGAVMNPGEAILTLHWGSPYVLAYLRQSYLLDVAVGDEVVIRTGRLSRHGRIAAILPMSSGIPDEFRTAFKHRETRQLARIALESGVDIPTLSTVRITRDWRAALGRWWEGWGAQMFPGATARNASDVDGFYARQKRSY